MDSLDGLEHKVSEFAEALKPRLRGVLHEAAFAISLVTGTVLICLSDNAHERVAASVYAGSVALLFGTSGLYGARAAPLTSKSRTSEGANAR